MLELPEVDTSALIAEDIRALLPQLVDKSLVDEIPPVELLLQRRPPDVDVTEVQGYVDTLEEALSATLFHHGIYPCRRTSRLVAGLPVPVRETIYYRPSEQLLLEAMRDTHPVLIVSTFEQQRYIDALVAHEREAPETRQVWIWRGASGRPVLELACGTPDPKSASSKPPKTEVHVGFISQYAQAAPPDFDMDLLTAALVRDLEDPLEGKFEYREREGSFWAAVTLSDTGNPHLHLVIDDRPLTEREPEEIVHLLLSQVDDFVTERIKQLAKPADADVMGFDVVHTKGVRTFVQMLTTVTKLRSDAICLAPDAHHFLDAENRMSNVLENISALKDVYYHLSKQKTSRKLILFVGELSLPNDLREEVLRIELPLPGRRELFVVIRDLLVERGMPESRSNESFEEGIARLSDEAAGMTLAEVRAVLLRVADSAPIEEYKNALRVAKRRNIARAATLELVDPTAAVELGGMDTFLQWLDARRKVFVDPERARTIGIRRSPRGVLLLGLPGSGKSLAAKVIAREWRLPLIRLDIGAVRDKYVGSSESRIREALKVIEAMSPCIAWIDEIEKGVSQADNVNSSSADLNIRATLLTWMQEHRYPVFVIATANRFEHLPPELTRAGRFDARFFFGCPGDKGREGIFDVHLTSRGYPSARFNLPELVKASLGFTGAEIEQAVVDSLYASFAREEPLSTAMLLEHVLATKPLIRAAGDTLDEVWDLLELGRVEPASSDMLARVQVAKLIDPYLYRPCYCRLDAIHGFDKQHAAAGRILMSSPMGGPAAVVMKSGDLEWLYVETNFRMDPADIGVFKFVDTFETIELNFVFDTLLSDYALEAIYFEDPHMRERFENSEALQAYAEMFRDVAP